MATTLTWIPNSESDLAGYRLYQCSSPACTKSSASLLATLGKVTSFNIGTPSVTQYYFITAFDNASNESSASSLVTVTPTGPAPTPPTSAVTLTVVGNPAAGPWGVEGTTSDLRDVMASVRLDGVEHHIEHNRPYGFPGDNGVTVTTAQFGNGSHRVEFVFYLEGTTTEIGRASVAVQEGSPALPPPRPIQTANLKVVGNPAIGPWGVEGTISDLRDLMASVRLDGVEHHVEHQAPWSFPGDNGIAVTPEKFGPGSHTVEFVFYLEGATTEIGRASVTVQEGSQATLPPPSIQTVNLTVVGTPATGPWGVAASTSDIRDVMATVRLDGVEHHVEHSWPYTFPGDNGMTAMTALFGRGSHTVEFIFYLEGTTTEVGRASVTVQEG